MARLRKIAPAGYFLALHIRFAAPLMQFQTYPVAWTDRYAQNAYALRDPTIAWGFSTTGSCRWSSLPVPDPFGICKDAAAHGLTYGLTVSCGPIDDFNRSPTTLSTSSPRAWPQVSFTALNRSRSSSAAIR